MKRTLIIPNEIALQSAIGAMRSEFKATGYLRVSLSTDKPRTLPQNSLIYGLYGQISREGGQESIPEVRRRLKLHHGVPILRAEDPEFREAYDTVIKPLTYEQKLKAMDFWPVTSRMNTSQLSQYVASIEKESQMEKAA